jgi:hypothetical protein
VTAPRTSPYRALPVVTRPRPRSVCLWCKHCRVLYPPNGSPLCDARERVELHPVEGSRIVDRGLDCYVVRSMQRERGEDECPYFDPTVVTRVLRAIGGRR